MKSKKTAKKNADKWFSKYIRLRDASPQGICKCCTCGRAGHWKRMDAGHFILRDKEATRYDERNVHAQCGNCNRFRSGEQFEHYKFIVDQYGKDVADELDRKSKMDGLMKRIKSDYEYISDYYRKEAKRIAKEKGIEL